jgi:hypothetical protein
MANEKKQEIIIDTSAITEGTLTPLELHKAINDRSVPNLSTPSIDIKPEISKPKEKIIVPEILAKKIFLKKFP